MFTVNLTAEQRIRLLTILANEAEVNRRAAYRQRSGSDPLRDLFIAEAKDIDAIFDIIDAATAECSECGMGDSASTHKPASDCNDCCAPSEHHTFRP